MTKYVKLRNLRPGDLMFCPEAGTAAAILCTNFEVEGADFDVIMCLRWERTQDSDVLMFYYLTPDGEIYQEPFYDLDGSLHQRVKIQRLSVRCK